jgi:hypothetical protein
MAKTLQEKLDNAARAVEPVLWKLLDEIENEDNKERIVEFIKGDWICTITGEVMDDFGNIIDEDDNNE